MPRYQRPSSIELAQQKAQRAMVEGVGGLQFVAQAPPGLGRLIRIPFYQVVATIGFASLDPGVIANAAAMPAAYAAGSASATHPVVSVLPPVGPITVTATATLATPQISWATMRIVGFEAIVYEPILPAVPMMQFAFQNLQIGGGATLFVHQDFAPAGMYLAGQDSFAGLRDYPLLRSPNTSTVQIQGVGDGTGLGPDAVSFSCNLVCEILMDDNYGSHIPGPYARPGALVRQGGSFVQ